MAQMEGAFNKNTKAFSDGIQMLEAQNEVLRRVNQALFDAMRGHGLSLGDKVRFTDDGKIDFNAYLKEYIEELVALEAKKPQEEHGPALVTREDEDAPIIFGGDHA